MTEKTSPAPADAFDAAALDQSSGDKNGEKTGNADSTDRATERPRIAPRDQRVIWLLLAATFVVILNETIMSVALPKLMDDLLSAGGCCPPQRLWSVKS